MAHFEAELHQIRLRLHPARGAYSAPADTLSWISRAYFKGKGREEDIREGRVEERLGRGVGCLHRRDGDGKGRKMRERRDEGYYKSGTGQ